jgi:uncharacterized lipoprotein
MRRRQLLTAAAIGIASIAGCSGGSGDEDEASTGTSMDDGEDSDLSTPEATVKTFYNTLYGNDDIEGTNELYHPESRAPELSEADFEQYGGVSAIGSEVESTETVSQSESEVEIHAEIAYSSPAGSVVETDWFTLAPSDGEWMVLSWTPEAIR